MRCSESTSVVLRSSSKLDLTDEHNTLLGTTTVAENPTAEGVNPSPSDCIFDFSVPNVPDTATFYTITTAIGSHSLSHAELVASHWRADLNVTSS